MTRRGKRWLWGGIAATGLLLTVAGPLANAISSGSPVFAQEPDGAPAVAAAADQAASATDQPAPDQSATAEQSTAAERSGSAEQDPTAEPAGEPARLTGREEADSSTSIVGGNVSSFSAGDIFGLIWRLALVGVIIWASIYALRRFVARGGKAQSGSGALKVLESVGVANNRLITLVEAGDRILVVGHTPSHIALLSEVEDPQVMAALRGDANPATQRVATVGDLMRQVGRGMDRFSSWQARRGAHEAASNEALSADLTPVLQQMLREQAAAEGASAAPAPARPRTAEAE